MAHCDEQNVTFVKCANCGRYFVPDGRKDMIYCPYPASFNSTKTCREIGAQRAFANKAKKDAVTGQYRKLYMRFQMNVKRHPGDSKAYHDFCRLTDEMKSWRKKLKEGSATSEECLEWLNSFQ